jgi:enterochelin esterase-like enzyme
VDGGLSHAVITNPRRRLIVWCAAAILLSAALARCGGTSSTTASASSSTTSSAPGTSTGNGEPRIVDGSFHSNAVNGTLHYAIALPPGYDTSGKRYPVVYFLHGLPANENAYKGITGYADSLAASGVSAIVVGAQGARPGDTDPEWHDWGPGRNWETATESELVAWIDHHYRTIAERSGRAIVGVSAGGYGATLIAIHHPETYQVIESWSGYFVLTTPEGKPQDLGSPQANANASAHASVPQLKQKFGPYDKTLFGFYIGAQDPYPGFVADNELLSKELTDAGIPHVFKLYEGAHNGAFWSEHQDEWLAAAVKNLDPPS